MLGKLGRPYRVWFQSYASATGLINIQAIVKKPNGANLGPFILTEELNSSFVGMYYFDLVLSTAQPEGEYLVFIDQPGSPSQAPLKVTMESEIDVSFKFEDFDLIGVIVSKPLIFGRLINQPVVKGVVYTDPEIRATIISNQIVASIIPRPELKATIGCEDV